MAQSAAEKTSWRENLGKWRHRIAGFFVFKLLWRTVRLFRKSRCPLWSSALTYYSIFAMVPILALGFALAKGFGLEEWLSSLLVKELEAHQDILQSFLSEEMANPETLMHWIMGFVDKALMRTRGGWLAGIGVLMLLYSVLAMIHHIENAVGAVMGVKSGRRLVRIFTDYLAMVFICPILLILATSATLLFNGAMHKFFGMAEWMTVVGKPVMWMLQWVTPWLLASIFFMALFLVMSNGRMRFIPALTGGVVAGVLMRLLQGGYFMVQLKLTSYNAIYGSFAAIPLFLIWMYLNWNAILAGVAVGSTLQGLRTNEFDDDDDENKVANLVLDSRLLMLVTGLIVQDFVKERPAPAEDALAERCGIGLRRLRQVLQVLSEAHIVLKVMLPDGETGFAPALPPEHMTTAEVRKRLNELFKTPQPESPEARELESKLDALATRETQSEYNRSLADL